MYRFTALSFSTILAAGASLAHADVDFQFANMTSVELGGNTFSVDVQATWTDPADQSETIDTFLMVLETTGLELLSIDPLVDYWTMDSTAETIFGLGSSLTGLPPVYIFPEAEPVGLFTMNLEITQFSGELEIKLFDLLVSGPNTLDISTGSPEYSLVIPAPAGLAFLVVGLGGLRRRRTG